LRNPFLDEVKRERICSFATEAIALMPLFLSLRGRAFVFHGRGNLVVNLFGWSFEEGIFTSSIGKDETASSLHFVSFLAVTTRNGHCEGAHLFFATEAIS